MLLKERKLTLFLAIALVLALSSCSHQPSYSTYEDCVLAEIGPSQSQAAVAVIQDACRSKFPPSEAQLAVRRQAFDREARDAQMAEDAANAAAKAAAAAVEAQEK